jgi:hypothetical protein
MDYIYDFTLKDETQVIRELRTLRLNKVICPKYFTVDGEKAGDMTADIFGNNPNKGSHSIQFSCYDPEEYEHILPKILSEAKNWGVAVNMSVIQDGAQTFIKLR